MCLSIDTGNLDGNVIDIGGFQSFQIMPVAMIGFLVAQDYLAQQIDILACFLPVTILQMMCERRTFPGNNDRCRIFAQTPFDDGYGNKIEVSPQQ